MSNLLKSDLSLDILIPLSLKGAELYVAELTLFMISGEGPEKSKNVKCKVLHFISLYLKKGYC